MIWMEAVAAGLVGLSLLVLVLGPLVAGHTSGPEQPDEPEELDETRRGAALLALKEIEFDKATGKLSDEDYATLKAKYTVEALAALREPEPKAASPGQDPASVAPPLDFEAIVARRVEVMQQGGAAVDCPVCGPRPEADALYCSGCGRALSPTTALPAEPTPR